MADMDTKAGKTMNGGGPDDVYFTKTLVGNVQPPKHTLSPAEGENPMPSNTARGGMPMKDKK